MEDMKAEMERYEEYRYAVSKARDAVDRLTEEVALLKDYSPAKHCPYLAMVGPMRVTLDPFILGGILGTIMSAKEADLARAKTTLESLLKRLR